MELKIKKANPRKLRRRRYNIYKGIKFLIIIEEE